MLESSPAFLKCYQCKRGPKEFSFLLCNHIICGKCISKNIQISDKYNLVKCSCGCQTYFNEENQIVQLQDSAEFRAKKVDLRVKTQQDHIYETKQKKPVKKRKTFNSQDFCKNSSQSFNQLSKKMIGTENTVCEQVSSGEVTEKGSKSKHINQFSTHYITENNNRQSFLGERKSFMIPNVKNLKSSVTVPQSPIEKSLQKEDNQIHTRFQNEIEFMSLLFKKDFQQVQYQFSKCLNEIKNIYQAFQNSLRSLYAEQIIKNKTEIALNLSDIIKERYDKQIALKFKSLKDNLLAFFHSFRHNQNLNSPKAPSGIHLTQFAQQKKKRNHSNDTMNYSQIIDDLENYNQTMKNNKVQKFQTVEEKLQRLTTKNHEIRNKHSKNQLNLVNSSSMKRVQTQNIHANINSHPNFSFLGKQNLHRANHSFDEFTPEMNFRFSQKTHKRSNPASFEKQVENKRRQALYFSPSVPYCYKHLKEKKSEAKNYLSFIEKLCHEKKMNNNQELFKKVKQSNQIYEFKNRD